MRPFDGKYENQQKSSNADYFALALTVPEILTFQIFEIRKVGQGHGIRFRNDANRSQISKCTKMFPCIFALALIVSKILTFQICDLQHVGQGHGV